MDADKKRLIKSYGDIAEAILDELRLAQTATLSDELFQHLSPHASSQRVQPYFANSMYTPQIEFTWNGNNELRISFIAPDNTIIQEFRYYKGA